MINTLLNCNCWVKRLTLQLKLEMDYSVKLINNLFNHSSCQFVFFQSTNIRLFFIIPGLHGYNPLIPRFYSALFGQLLSAMMAVEGYYERRKLLFSMILPSQKFGMYTEVEPNVVKQAYKINKNQGGYLTLCCRMTPTLYIKSNFFSKTFVIFS